MAAATDHPKLTLNQAVTIALREAGVTVLRIQHVSPPYDTGGEAEIWFEGRTQGQKGPTTRLTAYLRDAEGAEPVVSEGW